MRYSLALPVAMDLSLQPGADPWRHLATLHLWSPYQCGKSAPGLNSPIASVPWLFILSVEPGFVTGYLASSVESSHCFPSPFALCHVSILHCADWKCCHKNENYRVYNNNRSYTPVVQANITVWWVCCSPQTGIPSEKLCNGSSIKTKEVVCPDFLSWKFWVDP